jgi:ABC-type nickel/cobalt efflux system permease component RcnA
MAAAPTPAGLPSFREADPLADLVAKPNLDPLPFTLALLAAFGWGAAHALTPGHGKTIVAAYLVGSRGTTRHALFLGLTTTLTHTLGVFLLGLITLFASEFILPEQLYPWLGLISGALVVALGLSLFRGYLRYLLQPEGHEPHSHDHDHDHTHPHDHTHHHDHGHSHLPPGADGSTISWAGLLALGVSGGLIPCPSALIVMLSAIALQRIGFGLLLIIAFSLGLAGTLTAIGILWVQARRFLERQRLASPLFSPPLRGGWVSWLRYGLPAASALLITMIGLGITVQAFMQTGLLG